VPLPAVLQQDQAAVRTPSINNFQSGLLSSTTGSTLTGHQTSNSTVPFFFILPVQFPYNACRANMAETDRKKHGSCIIWYESSGYFFCNGYCINVGRSLLNKPYNKQQCNSYPNKQHKRTAKAFCPVVSFTGLTPAYSMHRKWYSNQWHFV